MKRLYVTIQMLASELNVTYKQAAKLVARFEAATNLTLPTDAKRKVLHEEHQAMIVEAHRLVQAGTTGSFEAAVSHVRREGAYMRVIDRPVEVLKHVLDAQLALDDLNAFMGGDLTRADMAETDALITRYHHMLSQALRGAAHLPDHLGDGYSREEQRALTQLVATLPGVFADACMVAGTLPGELGILKRADDRAFRAFQAFAAKWQRLALEPRVVHRVTLGEHDPDSVEPAVDGEGLPVVSDEVSGSLVNMQETPPEVAPQAVPVADGVQDETVVARMNGQTMGGPDEQERLENLRTSVAPSPSGRGGGRRLGNGHVSPGLPPMRPGIFKSQSAVTPPAQPDSAEIKNTQTALTEPDSAPGQTPTEASGEEGTKSQPAFARPAGMSGVVRRAEHQALEGVSSTADEE